MKPTILVTGGAGFIGANFICYLLKKYQQKYSVINLDKLTYAGNLDHLREVQSHSNYNFINGDICNEKLVNEIFSEYKISSVIHFAAESHVDNSITSPKVFFETNVIGTFNLLQAAKKNWLSKPHQINPGYEQSKFHHISTDEVYGTLGEEGKFTESTPYAPNSPYSASKASSDFAVRSYNKTFGLNTSISNCSNNFGPKQHVEKLIPTIIRKAIKGESIPIYGNGKNIRDWLYVEDHCSAIDLIFHQGKAGETYNIGTDNELANIEICQKICEILDKKIPRSQGSYKDLIEYVTDRPGHDFRYAIDHRKITDELGWKPEYDFDKTLDLTIEWYLELLA